MRTSGTAICAVVLVCLGSVPSAASAKPRFSKLSAVGVTADRAAILGQKLQVRIRTRRTVRIGLALVAGRRVVQTFKPVIVRRGRRTLTRTLKRAPPSLDGLKLRVTATRGRRRARGLLPIVANLPPTGLALSAASVPENQPPGTEVGLLSATDPNPGDVLTFALVSGAGADDNGAFEVVGNALRTVRVFDAEERAGYSIRVRVADGRGGTFERSLAITVSGANDPPTDILLSAATVPENEPAGTTVGLLGAADQDGISSHSFELVSGAGDSDNAAFAIAGTALQTAAAFDFEARSAYTIRVRTTDNEGATYEKPLTVTVTNVYEPPADLTLSNTSIVEGPEGRPVGTLAVPDPEAGEEYAFALTDGAGSADNARFAISGTTLTTAEPFTFSPGLSYSVRIAVTDTRGQSFAKPFTITVTKANLAPTDITLSASSLGENQPPGTPIGAFSASDPDAGDSATFALVTGIGDEDNASFAIDGATLESAETFDFEAQSNFSIRVRATDSEGAAYEKVFEVLVTDVNDPPSDLGLSGATVEENLPAGTALGTLSSTDQDAGASHTYALVAGAGSEDGAQFAIVGSTLQTATELDFEAGATRSIRVRSTDDGGLTHEKPLTITVTDRNDAPVASDDSFSGASRAVGNTSLVGDDPADAAPDPAGPQKTVSGDILSNDTDQDENGSLTAVAGTFATNDGGTVDLESDGDFTYHPNPGTSCSDHSDFFDYAVSDQNSTRPPGTAATDVGRVTIEIQDCVWYADSSLGVNGNGTSGSPFNSLADLDGAGGSGDVDAGGQRIFLYDGTYPGGLRLEASQTVFGRRHGLAVPDGGAGTTTLVPAGGANSMIGGGLVLAQDNTVQGVHLGDASGPALSGTSVGTAQVNTVTSGAIDNQTGAAVSINGGTLDMTFTAVSSSASAASGIALSNVAGQFTAAGGALAGATGADVALTGGSANFTYGGTISDSSGSVVSISGQTGGTKDFNGAITGGAVSLTSNAGATLRFDGGLTLATGAGPAFAATGGGTLAVTDPAGAASNTITTTTGTALHVANTTIGGDELTFERISSDGAPSGIVLNGTGATGGLTVTGAGSANSGGTIGQSTGPGISLSGVDGGVSLSRMLITGGGDDGIRATSMTGGLSLANSTVSNNGNAVGERGLDYSDVAGSSSITGSTITGSAETNARLASTAAGSASLSITGSTFSSNSTTLGAHGLEIRGGTGGTTSALVSNNTFSANRDNAFLLANDAGSPTLNLRFEDNTVSGGNGGAVSGQPGVVVAPTAGAQTTASLTTNQIHGTLGRALILNSLPGSTSAARFDATVVGNVIGTDVPFSGSAQGEGMMLRAGGNGDVRFAVRNNTVRRYAQFGMWLRAQEGTAGTGNADFTVTGNTVSDPSGSGFEGIYVSTGATAGDNMSVCADIGGSSAALENAFTATGIGVTDIAFSRRFSTHLELRNYNPSAQTLAAYIQGRNAGSPSVSSIDLAPEARADTPCLQPTLPPL